MECVVERPLYRQFFPNDVFLEKDPFAIVCRLHRSHEFEKEMLYNSDEIINLNEGDEYISDGKLIGTVILKFSEKEITRYVLNNKIIHDSKSFDLEKEKFFNQFDKNNEHHLDTKKNIEFIEFNGVFF